MTDLDFHNTSTPVNFSLSLEEEIPCPRRRATVFCRITGKQYDVDGGIYDVDYVDSEKIYLCGEEGTYVFEHNSSSGERSGRIACESSEWIYPGAGDIWNAGEDESLNIYNSYATYATNPDSPQIASIDDDAFLIHEGRTPYELKILEQPGLRHVSLRDLRTLGVRRYLIGDHVYEPSGFFVCRGELYYCQVQGSIVTYHIASRFDNEVKMHEGVITNMGYGYGYGYAVCVSSIRADTIRLYKVSAA